MAVLSPKESTAPSSTSSMRNFLVEANGKKIKKEFFSHDLAELLKKLLETKAYSSSQQATFFSPPVTTSSPITSSDLLNHSKPGYN
jgi:hypothetical protein